MPGGLTLDAYSRPEQKMAQSIYPGIYHSVNTGPAYLPIEERGGAEHADSGHI